MVKFLSELMQEAQTSCGGKVSPKNWVSSCAIAVKERSSRTIKVHARSTPEAQQYSFYGTTFSKRGFDYYARKGKKKGKRKDCI